MNKLIFLVIFILCGMRSFSQIYVPKNPTVYGNRENRFKADSSIGFPSKDTLLNTSDTSPQIFYRPIDSTFYGWSLDKGFFKIGSGNGTGTDNGSYHSMSTSLDSMYGILNRPNGTKDSFMIVADGFVGQGGGGGTYTASNGLTLNGSDIQLGGTISKSTTINTSTYPLVLNGNGDASSNVLKVTTTDGYPLWSTSVNNLALYAKSTNGQAAEFDIKPTSTNTVASAMTIFRGSQGTAANGLGTSLDYELQDVGGFIQISNQLITKWSDAAPTTRTSEFSITGVNNAITGNILRIAGNGNAQFYGTVQLKGYTVATLPTGVQGMTAYVTDASSPAFLATVVGGGSTVVKVFYNGTNWIVQ